MADLAEQESPVSLPTAGGTRQVILDTARRLFDEQGYDATSLRQIADAVGTTKAAVYYHFPAKEHLLVELTRPLLDEMSSLLTHMRNDQIIDRSALAAYLDLIIEHLSLVSLMARDPAMQNHPDVGPRARALVEGIKQVIAGAEPSAERIVRAACAMGAIHAASTLPHDRVRDSRGVILDAAAAALAER